MVGAPGQTARSWGGLSDLITPLPALPALPFNTTCYLGEHSQTICVSPIVWICILYYLLVPDIAPPLALVTWAHKSYNNTLFCL